LANVIERATLLADGEELLPDVLQLPTSDKRASRI
jgi:hypothetical protein